MTGNKKLFNILATILLVTINICQALRSKLKRPLSIVSSFGRLREPILVGDQLQLRTNF